MKEVLAECLAGFQFGGGFGGSKTQNIGAFYFHLINQACHQGSFGSNHDHSSANFFGKGNDSSVVLVGTLIFDFWIFFRCCTTITRAAQHLGHKGRLGQSHRQGMFTSPGPNDDDNILSLGWSDGLLDSLSIKVRQGSQGSCRQSCPGISVTSDSCQDIVNRPPDDSVGGSVVYDDNGSRSGPVRQNFGSNKFCFRGKTKVFCHCAGKAVEHKRRGGLAIATGSLQESAVRRLKQGRLDGLRAIGDDLVDSILFGSFSEQIQNLSRGSASET
mmetsp:Transcript_23304/g.41324  ORF Transcript_23304/g.41324 Transcript_23304/m.41324 type:complete len:272 (+) Transcript_23304:2180-2995(+)